MKNLRIGTGALTGALLTAPLIAISYLGAKASGLPFVPFDVFDWLTRALPGAVVTASIDLMIDVMRLAGVSVAQTAKSVEHALAILQVLVLGSVVSAAFFAVVSWRRIVAVKTAGALAGVMVAVPMIAVSLAIRVSGADATTIVPWLALVFVLWGTGLGWVYTRLHPALERPVAEEPSVATPRGVNRRRFLVQLGAASATLTFGGSAIGALMAQAIRRDLEQTLASAREGVPVLASGPLPNADDPIIPAPGTRPETTPLEDHYKVFIRAEPTVIASNQWTLPVFGHVANPMSFTLDDIRSRYKAREQYVTISCISGRVGTDLIGTERWVGASLQDVLADVKPTSEARYLYIQSADGFYETVDLDLIASDPRIMLCYAWNEDLLPIDHGFPLRIWIPDRFGMKQPKWITSIEVVPDYRPGFWVERGWDKVARMQATSVIDTVAVDAAYETAEGAFVPVGGIAFAGARGISRVEVRVDGGPWKRARLRAPLSSTAWVIWRYDWPFESGRHEFEVRCAEGDDTPQVEAPRDSHPSGATGIHAKVVRL